MTNQLEKLKNSIRHEYVKNFELNLMKTSGFIPVDKRQNDFFVILNKDNAANRAQIESIIKAKYADLSPKFIPISPVDFEEMIVHIGEINTNIMNQNTNENASESDTDSTTSEPTAEEMLVGVGWITQAQLDECTKIAKNRNVPLDAILYEKEYLSYEHIVSYLKKKYGCNVVSKSNIVVDNNMLKLLPDDFVEKKQIIIMSMEDNKLAVAMVNPNDKYTIRETSLSTGRSLNVYCIPYFEYDLYLREYLVQKKNEQTIRETERIIQNIEEETAQFNNEESLWAQVEKELQDASVNVEKFVYKIITAAIDAKASDIHI